ncbi:toll/interleukin-1 receptor domain-containing protein [Xanthomonas euvesicatoria]|uniref:toll/interleukin-1 receptor domain-containing protein n=1 Tax=Xanthomonas euvesicatoria TaxID=456327 RepID=UPI001C450DCE|nr:toll/interleukin-1 receptor domain-containing protein [Xanthomonas euvesicatoria]MBV6896549.1 toll/interleukin-1 receptor domain-containing protein [Xanthomonas campestris pv. ionidii]
MAEDTSIVESDLVKSSNPLVFISHDTRDAELAEAFSNLLKSVSAGVLKSFRASDRRGNQGIEYGIEWYPEIIKNIQSASDVVCLLTERSVNRPWILFEAGMAKGKLDTPILGVALGIELKLASTGPFAQFQNCGDDDESLTKLVFQLVNRIPGSEPDKDTIRFQVSKFKSSVEGILNSLAKQAVSTSSTKRKQDDIENSSVKLFEEIKIMFQDLPSRIERVGTSRDTRKRRKIHLGMVEELMYKNKNPIVGARIGLSLLREILPWVYDEGCLLISKMQSARTPAARKKIFLDFDQLIMASTQNRYLEKYLVENDEDYRLLQQLPRMIMRALARAVE